MCIAKTRFQLNDGFPVYAEPQMHRGLDTAPNRANRYLIQVVGNAELVRFGTPRRLWTLRHGCALWPATILQHHPHVTVLLDDAAARRLQLVDYYRETYRSKPEWQGI